MTNDEFEKSLKEMNEKWHDAEFVEKNHEKAQEIQDQMDRLCQHHARMCDMRIREAHRRMGFGRRW